MSLHAPSPHLPTTTSLSIIALPNTFTPIDSRPGFISCHQTPSHPIAAPLYVLIVQQQYFHPLYNERIASRSTPAASDFNAEPARPITSRSYNHLPFNQRSAKHLYSHRLPTWIYFGRQAYLPARQHLMRQTMCSLPSFLNHHHPVCQPRHFTHVVRDQQRRQTVLRMHRFNTLLNAHAQRRV